MLLTIGVVFFCTQNAHAQYDFKVKQNQKSNPEIIYFKILGIADEQVSELLGSQLEALPQIETVDISYNYKCVIKTNSIVSAKAVRDILLSNNCDFFFPSLDVDDPGLYDNLEEFRRIMMPENFPCESDYETKGDYESAIEAWRKENPEDYNILKELNYL